MNLEELYASNTTFAISGLVSSAVKTSGKTNGHPQFFFINSRPVELPKAVRIVNECYRHATSCTLCIDAIERRLLAMYPGVLLSSYFLTFNQISMVPAVLLCHLLCLPCSDHYLPMQLIA